MKIKSPDDWAKEFKLHNCIGNRKFAAQIKAIQADALAWAALDFSLNKSVLSILKMKNDLIQ